MHPTLRRWLGPSLVAVLVLLAYSWFVAPKIRELSDDLAFLHAARLQAIHQAQAPKGATP